MKKNSNWNLLWNPFTRIAGWQAFWVGIVIVIISTILAHYGGLLLMALWMPISVFIPP